MLACLLMQVCAHGTRSLSEKEGQVQLQGCRSGADLVEGYGGAATPAVTSSGRGIETVLRGSGLAFSSCWSQE